MNEQVIPVSGNQKIAFQCQRCSTCCRHVENKVMLEPYDVYQLALHFQCEAQSVRPEDICAQYAHPMPLEPYFPIFLLNAVGEDQHCIFLNGNHCSIYAHRPRACRMYPLWIQGGAVRTSSIFSARITPVTSAKAASGSATGSMRISPRTPAAL